MEQNAESPKVDFNDESKMVKVLKKVFVYLRNYFAVVGLIATVAPLFVLSAIGSMSIGGGKVSDTTLETATKDAPVDIYAQFNGPLAQRESDGLDSFLKALSGEEREIYLPSFRGALRRAKEDPRIKGLSVDLTSVSGSKAEFSELRRILKDFRASGKSVRVYAAEPNEWQYYVASVADEIIINPGVSMLLPGPYFELTYFGEAFRKLGIDWEVLRAGSYKSAVEPFIMNDPSGPALEQYMSMENSLREHMIQAIAEGRGKPPADVTRWLKESIYTAEAAIEEGIVDKLGYPTGPNDDESNKLVKFHAYLGEPVPEDEQKMDPDNKDGNGIGLIEAVGNIVMNGDGNSDVIEPKSLTRKFQWARKDDKVKAVVFRISSPGGSATASDLIWKEVEKTSAVKPVIVSMGAAAASGGYYIAAPARHIVAEPTTITGSIGVFGLMPRLGAFRDKYGVSNHIVTQTDRAKIFNPFEKPSSFDVTMMSGTIDYTYQTFLQRVAAGRKMEVEAVEPLAGGRVYTGLEALEKGLVDSLGGLQDAFQIAKKEGGLNPDYLYPVLRYRPVDMSFEECLAVTGSIGECFGAGSSIEIKNISGLDLVPGMESIQQFKKMLDNEERQVHVMALWPGYYGLRPN